MPAEPAEPAEPPPPPPPPAAAAAAVVVMSVPPRKSGTCDSFDESNILVKNDAVKHDAPCDRLLGIASQQLRCCCYRDVIMMLNTDTTSRPYI
jgi:hypothetical protein